MRFLFVISTLLVFNASLLQAQNLPFESLTVENGLSQGMIFSILQSQDGFIWIATKDGLNRYDGFEFKVFSNDPFDPWSLSENTVTALFQDSKGRLWAGSQDRGLNLYDAHTQRFYHVSRKNGSSHGLADNAVTSIAEDPTGRIWVVCKNQLLSCFQLPDNLPDQPDLNETVTWLENPPRLIVTDRLEQKRVSCARLLHDGRLLVGNRDGLYEIDWKHNSVQMVDSIGISVKSQGVFDILEDRNGAIWLGCTDKIIILKDQQVIAQPMPIPNGDRTEFAKGGDKSHVWVYSTKKLWQFEPETGYTQTLSDIRTRYNGNTFVINTAMVDQTGILWCGTNGYGIRKFSRRMYDFSNYVPDQGIWSVFEDRQSRVWIKVFFDYFLLNRETGTTTIPPFLLKSANMQRSLIQDRQNRFWLLSKVKEQTPLTRLACFSPDFQLLSSVDFEAHFTQESRIFEDRAGYLWIGGAEGILFRFDPVHQSFTKFNYSHLFDHAHTTIETTTLVEDGGGTFWIGTKHGLVKGVPEHDSLHFSLYSTDPLNRFSLANNFVLSIYAPPGNSPWLWIGTKGGLGRLNKTTGQFKFFNKKDGLPDNVVYGVLPAQTENTDAIWVSTNRGLSKISGIYGDQVVFRNYGVENGLPGMEFNTGAYYRSESGELLFGGVNGLTIFRSENLTINPVPPQIHITGIGVNNHELAPFDATGILRQAVEFSENITLNSDQNLFSIRFAATDYTASSQNHFRYRLVGVDRDWVEADTKNVANYSQVRPGTYQFEVLGSNSDGVWSTNTARLTVVVNPPWWQSWWAYTFYICLLGWAAWAFYQIKIRRVRLENQLLFEKREASRLAEIDEIKNRFFSNVTHEFRTPLTLIIEPLRQAASEISDPKALEKVRLAEKNSRQLLQLVNQLLDISKIEHGNMELDLRKDDFQSAVMLTYQSFLPLADQKRIRMKFEADSGLTEFWFDRNRMEMVVNNLLSNAMKFTPEGGTVLVSIRRKISENMVTLQVADNGIGIPATALQYVFDRFYQVDNSNTRRVEGTGIGLALTKDLVKLMGGKIEVHSPGPNGAGSVFTVVLPMVKLDNQSTFTTEKSAGIPTQASEESNTVGTAPTDQQQLILIIEDNPELRKFVRQSLPSFYQVIEASDGASGVLKALEFVPDLIISDVMMPEKDGYQVCDELKSNEVTSHIPIILLTARVGLDSKLTGLRTGADDYLTKPFNTEELVVRIENLIETRRVLREKYSNQPSIKPDATSLFSKIDQEFLQKLTLLLDKQLDNDALTVEDFARQLFISRVQLHRKLKALTAQSATDFIRNYRLDRAMELLKNKEGNVTQVAGMVGFGNEKYFSTVFKEKFGVSPSQIM